METNPSASLNKLFAHDWRWQGQFTDQVRSILSKYLDRIIQIDVAPPDEDLHQATDFTFIIQGSSVAVRIRRKGYQQQHGDWTIRAWRSNGKPTELQKIKEGFANFYLYCWTDNDRILSWWLIDLEKVRRCGILERTYPVIKNKDGNTGFIAIPLYELLECEAILVMDEAPVPQGSVTQ
jgi:hypothetical protein